MEILDGYIIYPIQERSYVSLIILVIKKKKWEIVHLSRLLEAE
jgi:hypothetical protein